LSRLEFVIARATACDASLYVFEGLPLDRSVADPLLRAEGKFWDLFDQLVDATEAGDTAMAAHYKQEIFADRVMGLLVLHHLGGDGDATN